MKDMMRKFSLLFAGALMGAASMLAFSGHGLISANAAGLSSPLDIGR